MTWRKFSRIAFFLALLKLSTGCDVFEPGHGSFGAFGCYFHVEPGGGCTFVRTERERSAQYNPYPRETVVQTTELVPSAIRTQPITPPQPKTEPNPFAASDNLGMTGNSGVDVRSMNESGQPSSPSSSDSHHDHSHPDGY